MANFLETYKKITSYPLGHFIFNKMIGIKAPFFAKIHPDVLNLQPGLSLIEIKDRRGVRNHIGTIHATAMCTLAELCGGLALDSSIPKHLRWLPKAMNVCYLKKAKGTLRGKCEFDPAIIKVGDIVLPIELKDKHNEIVFTAEITFYVSEKKK